MKILYIPALFLFFVLTAYAQEEEKQYLSRKLFLEDADILDVQMAVTGKTVYYRRSGEPSKIFFIQPEVVGSAEKSMSFQGRVTEYAPTYYGGFLVAVKGDQGSKLVFARSGNKLNLTAFNLKEIDIITFSPKINTKAVVRLDSDNPKEKGVWLMDLPGGSPRRIGLMKEFDAWYYDDFLQVRAGKRTIEGDSIELLSKFTNKWERIQAYPPDVGRFTGGYQNIVSVRNDASKIYYTDNSETDKAVLMSIDRSGKKEKLTQDEVSDLLAGRALIDKAGTPRMIEGSYADPRPQFLDDAAKADFGKLKEKLEGNARILQESSDGKKWLLAELTGGPIKYYLYNRSANKLNFLFLDNEKLREYTPASRTAFTVRTRDAKQLPVHVYLPADTDSNGDGYPETELPTILFVHGGPWRGVSHWDSWALTRHFQLLTDRGYAVINTEFRGSGGLGKAFTDAGDGEWGGKMRLDLEDISRWAQKEGIAKDGKTALWGYSYGGYAALTAAGMSPDEFACYISMSGVSDLYGYVEEQGSALWTTRVGDAGTDEGKALLKKHSPINYVEKIKAPVLLVAGSQDTRVPQSHSDNFAEAADAAGKEVVYFYYPEEGHHFRQLNTWLSFWAITEQFLAKNLDGQFAPSGEDLDAGFYDIMLGADFIDALK